MTDHAPKKYFRGTEDKQVIQVGMDVVLGDAVLALVESGIDEDAHFWSALWQQIDNDDLEWALNSSTTTSRMFEYIRLPLIEKLKEVLATRRKEDSK